MTTPLFDPNGDPFGDVQRALEQARDEKKNVLLDLGGDWCIWCRRLETFILEHAELRHLRETHYITVKIYVGDEEATNFDFLQRLPSFDGVPHLFVYNSRGQLLRSQPTDPLEEGDSYNYERVKTFLTTWADWRLSPYDALSTEELKRRFERGMFPSDSSGPVLSA